MTRTVLSFALIFMLFTACNNEKCCKDKQSEKVIIGYVYGGGGVDWSAFDAKQYTHINYAFANIIDGKMAFEMENDYAHLQKLINSKKDNPELKILVSIGGWTWSGNFSDMALTFESRKVFIESAIAELKKTGIDGIDLDWEYPGQVGMDNVYRPEDKENFTLLLKELREALTIEQKEQNKEESYLLTIAVGADQSYIDHTNMAEVQKHLDHVNLMTYDFYTSADSLAAHHANLYVNKNDHKQMSANISVHLFEKAGVSRDKIVLGIPFYNRMWRNVENNGQNGRYALAGNIDSVSYEMVTEKIENGEFPLFYDELAKAKYRYSEKLGWFMSVEDTAIVRMKSKYIKDQNLAGAMFWSYRPSKIDLLEVLNEELR